MKQDGGGDVEQMSEGERWSNEGRRGGCNDGGKCKEVGRCREPRGSDTNERVRIGNIRENVM